MEGMDKLERIFELQNAFDTSLESCGALRASPPSSGFRRETLAMMSELSELIDEVNFQVVEKPQAAGSGAIREELVDILHFFVSMCLKVGMDADELYRLYTVKNKENFNRQQGKSDRPGYKAV